MHEFLSASTASMGTSGSNGHTFASSLTMPCRLSRSCFPRVRPLACPSQLALATISLNASAPHEVAWGLAKSPRAPCLWSRCFPGLCLSFARFAGLPLIFCVLSKSIAHVLLTF